MESASPSPQVLRAFGLEGDLVRTISRDVWRSGSAALKRADHAPTVNWVSDLLATANGHGFRVPSPISTSDGRWVEDGWSATTWLSGASDLSRWRGLLEAGDAFHSWLESVDRPGWLDDVDDLWRLADRVAWGEQDLSIAPGFRSLMDHLSSLLEPVSLVSQLVHGDLSGNVLFSDGQPPAIIDLTMYWRPRGYASAVVAVDCFEWGDAGPEVLEEVADHPDGEQMLVRAALFRTGRAAMTPRFDQESELAVHHRTAIAIEHLFGK